MTQIIRPQLAQDISIFDGQPIFGAPASFSCQEIDAGTAGSAAAIDVFLGRTVGTTKYGAGPNRLWGINGALVGTSSGSVAAMEATFLAFAGIVAVLGLPTMEHYPADFAYYPNSFFEASDFVPAAGGIVSIGGGLYSLSYAVVFRCLHGD